MFRCHVSLDFSIPHCIRQLAEQIHYIAACEAGAERATSREGIIRAGRFCLSADQATHELLLAFNSLPPRGFTVPSPPPTKPIQADLLENGTYPYVNYLVGLPPDGDADSSSAAPREEVARTEKRQREETLDDASFLQLIDELTTPAAVAATNELAGWSEKVLKVDADNVKPLSPTYGKQVVVMWYWRVSQWDNFTKHAEIRYLADPDKQTAAVSKVISFRRTRLRSFSSTLARLATKGRLGRRRMLAVWRNRG